MDILLRVSTPAEPDPSSTALLEMVVAAEPSALLDTRAPPVKVTAEVEIRLVAGPVRLIVLPALDPVLRLSVAAAPSH